VPPKVSSCLGLCSEPGGVELRTTPHVAENFHWSVGLPCFVVLDLVKERMCHHYSKKHSSCASRQGVGMVANHISEVRQAEH
jgi:hypothetical protein